MLTVPSRSYSHTAVDSDSMGRVHLHNIFFLSSKVESDGAVLLAIVALKPIRLGQENSCGLRCKNKKSPEAPRADLQGCANKSRDEILLFLCLEFSDAICGCCLVGKESRAQSGHYTERWELMAPSLGRGRNSPVPLPTLSLPVAVHCGGLLAGESAFAQWLGSASLQRRPGGGPRGRASSVEARRARL